MSEAGTVAVHVEREPTGASFAKSAGVALAGMRFYLTEAGVTFVVNRQGKFLACCPHCDRTTWYWPNEEFTPEWPTECREAMRESVRAEVSVR